MFVFVAWMVLLALPGSASAASRVALLNGDGSEPIANVVELAQVALSKEPELELLDRAFIRRVLEEQKLTVSGLVEASQAIAVGKLLAVDLIAVVETSPGQEKDKVPGLVIFDSRTGVRYWNATLPVAKELEKASEAIVAAVRTAHRKREGRTPAFHTVGLMTVRNADLPRSQDGLCEAVGLLVERGLSRSPDLAVLERRRLAHVNEERALPVVDPPKDLLASLTTIDLEIARGEGGRGLKAIALISNLKSQISNPKLNVTVSIPELNGVLLSEALLRKLMEELKAAPAEKGADPKLEARRFDGEAIHHYSHQRWGDAVRAMEAAWALDPTNEDVGERLCLYLIRYATFLFWPERHNIVSHSSDRFWMDARVEDAVLETLLTHTGRALEINARLTRPSAHWITINQPLSYLADRLQGFRNASESPRKERLDEMLQACRQRSLDYIAGLAVKAEADPNRLDNFGLMILQELNVIRASSVNTEQYARVMSQIADRWLTVTKDWKPEFNKSDGGAGLNMLLSYFVGPNTWTGKFDEPAFARVMAEQHAAMRKHVRPIVRLYGMLGQLRGEVVLGTISEEEGYRRFSSEFRKLAQEIVTSPEPWDAERTQYLVYESWTEALDMMPGKAARKEFVEREAIAFGEFMLDRSELHEKTFGLAVNNAKGQQRVDLLRKVLLVMDSPKFRDPYNRKERLKNQYQASIQEWLRKHPELASAPKLPWSKATKVFDIGRFRNLLELATLTVIKDAAVCIAVHLEDQHRELQLLRVPLSGSDATLLGRTELKLPVTSPLTFFATRFVTSMCVEKETLFVGTDGAGIVMFPLGNGSPSRIGVDEGLPTNNIRSVAVLDGKIYAGVSEGYLIAYDMAQKRCDVIASSRRKQKLSPLDDRKPFRVPMLIADPARKRIVFVIDDSLWQLTPADGRFTQLFNIVAVDQGRSGPKLTSDSIIWTSPRRSDRVLISDMTRCIEIDLSRDQAKLLHSPDHGVFPMTSSQLVVDGFLWSGSPFARLSLDKHEHITLPAPDNGSENFYPHIGLEPLANGKQILAADARTIWRLEFREGEAPAEPRTVEKLGSAGASPSRNTTPAAPVQKCVVKALVVTEDKGQLDAEKSVAFFQSFRNPSDRNGETVYGTSSGSRQKLEGGLATAEMQPGMISLGIFAPGYAPVIVGLREAKANDTLDLGTITLKKGFDWRLSIQNDLGQPVPNAEISAVYRYPELTTSTSGGPEGEAKLPHAAEAEYSLTVQAPGHQPTAFAKVPARADQVTTLKLLRARPTTGTVVDENGKPVAGARLLLKSYLGIAGREIAKTDDAGRFVLDQLKDNLLHTIHVEVNGRTRFGRTNIASGQTDQVWKLTPLIRLSGRVVGLSPQDARRMKYSQRILNERGEPAASLFSGEVNLDAEGRFRIDDLIPGVIQIEAFRRFFDVDLSKTNDNYVIDLAAPVPTKSTQPVPANVATLAASKSCAVQATIVTEDDQPLSNDGVCWIISRSAPYTSGKETQYGSALSRSASIRTGKLATSIDAGMISVCVTAPGYAPTIVGLKEAKPGETLDLGTITLKRGFTWKLSLRNESDQPIANGEISAVPRFGNLPIKLTSDAKGDVELTHAAEDEYTFIVRAPGHQPRRGITLRATADKPATLTLKPARPTGGLVVDEKGKPVADAQILLVRDAIESYYPKMRPLTKTNADGKFVLDQLGEMQSSVVRVDIDGKPRLLLTNVIAGRLDEVWKLSPSLTLSGRIEGMPVGGERTMLFDQHCLDHNGRMSGSYFSGTVRVAADGKFQIEGLLPGMVRLVGFRRYTDVDLPKSRDDFVLDLNAPEPSKAKGNVKPN